MQYPKPQKTKKPDRAQLKQRAELLDTLQEDLNAKDIYGCEVCYMEHREGTRHKINPGCSVIDPAHRHDRNDYYTQPEKLWTKNQVIFAGRFHHQMMDRNKEYREAVFQKLRGEDEMQERL